MKAEYRYAIASGNQDALLVEFDAIFETIEFALAERDEGGLMLEDGLEGHAGLLAPLVGIEESLLRVLVPVRLR